MFDKTSKCGLVDEMYTEAARLESFKKWPFDENAKCSAAKMAEAGFFHCPTEQEPDLVQCYVCFKELDGWEANDDPWNEHYSHSKMCVFAKIHKPQNCLKICEIFEIEAERKANKIKKLTALKIQDFKVRSEELEDFVTNIFDNIDHKN